MIKTKISKTYLQWKLRFQNKPAYLMDYSKWTSLPDKLFRWIGLPDSLGFNQNEQVY